MVEVEGLYYRYATLQALHNVSFTLQEGSITALIGSNGSGKSTLLRCMAALDSPYQGTIKLWGQDTRDDPRACHRMLGYLSDQFGMYDNLTVQQSLVYMAVAHRLPSPEVSGIDRVAEVATQLDLTDRLNQRVGELSRGFRQRVAIGQAIIHRPKLLLLDEPAAGLDPEARQELSDLLKEMGRQGMTIVVSSHILEELEKYSTHVLRMATGEVTGFDALNNYQKDHSQVLRLLFSRPALKVEETLKKQPNVSNIVLNGDWCEFVFKGKITEQSTLLMNLVNAGLPIAEMTVVKKHLQDRYLVDVSRVPPPKKVDDGLKHDEMAHIASTEHHPDPIG
jgi:ABC-2 type transport system ATP-binding protein